MRKIMPSFLYNLTNCKIYAIIISGTVHMRQAVRFFPSEMGVSGMSVLEILTLINVVINIINLAGNNKRKK